MVRRGSPARHRRSRERSRIARIDHRSQSAEDQADAEAEKLRDRYESRLKTAQRRLSEAERRVRELDVDVGQRLV